MRIIFFVKDLYTYPERYGSSIPEMRLSEVPQTARRYYKKYLAYDKDAKNYKKIIKRINNLSEESSSPVKLRII